MPDGCRIVLPERHAGRLALVAFTGALWTSSPRLCCYAHMLEEAGAVSDEFEFNMAGRLAA